MRRLPSWRVYRVFGTRPSFSFFFFSILVITKRTAAGAPLGAPPPAGRWRGRTGRSAFCKQENRKKEKKKKKGGARRRAFRRVEDSVSDCGFSGATPRSVSALELEKRVTFRHFGAMGCSHQSGQVSVSVVCGRVVANIVPA